MVPPPWNLADLQIIGYADERDESMRPAIVPPVFRSVSNPSIVLLPPYLIHYDSVSEATQIPYAEAEAMRDQGELTFLDDAPIPTQRGFELWLRRNGDLVYQFEPDARRERSVLSENAIKEAVAALAKGDLARAEEASSEAVLSNDRRVEPYAIKASIRRRNRDFVGALLMQELAAPLIGSSAFENLVRDYANAASTLCNVPPATRPNCHVMQGMAEVPPIAAA